MVAAVAVGAAAAAATATVIVYACESDPTPFDAVTVNAAVPAEVGVPDSAPVAASTLNPAGKAPADTTNVGAGVPDATIPELYAEPTVPAGSEEVVIDGTTTTAVTVTVNACESVPALFVAVTVKVTEPAEVGVPDTTPVAESKLKPAGRAPTDTENVGAVPDATTGEL